MRVPSQDVADIKQDVTMKLLRKGEVLVNARYVKLVIQSQIIDRLRTSHRIDLPKNEYSCSRSDEELRLLLHAAVSKLGSQSQLIYALIVDQGLTEREIAARLGVSRGAVRRWRDRLLRRLGRSPSEH